MRYQGVISERIGSVAGEVFPAWQTVHHGQKSVERAEGPVIVWPPQTPADEPEPVATGVKCADRPGLRRTSRRVLRETGKPSRKRDDVAVVGTTKIAHYVVSQQDSVRALAHRSVEFARKPEVMASARLVELCEMPCMEALREHISLEECTLGSRQYVDHHAPVAIGAHLTITARCEAVSGAFSEWDVQVYDEHEHVGGGLVSFVVVDQAAFERRRLLPKQRERRFTHRAGDVPLSAASVSR